MLKHRNYLKRTSNFVLISIMCAALMSGCTAKEKDET